MEPNDDPFRALGLAPTLDAQAIRRAYFAAVQRVPPHLDPAGFRRVRTAYERLSTAEGRSAALALAPVDATEELSALRARFDAPLADAADQARAASRGHAVARRFAEHLSGLTWDEAQRLGR
jgi:curved DNA-binding protein CbpA